MASHVEHQEHYEESSGIHFLELNLHSPTILYIMVLIVAIFALYLAIRHHRHRKLKRQQQTLPTWTTNHPWTQLSLAYLLSQQQTGPTNPIRLPAISEQRFQEIPDPSPSGNNPQPRAPPLFGDNGTAGTLPPTA